jgi:hypothetical protein
MLHAQPRRRRRRQQRWCGGREPDWVRPASASTYASASVRAHCPARRRPCPTARQRPKPQPTHGVRAQAVTIDSVCVVPPFPPLLSLARGSCIRGLECPLRSEHASCVKSPKATNRISHFVGLNLLAGPGARLVSIFIQALRRVGARALLNATQVKRRCSHGERWGMSHNSSNEGLTVHCGRGRGERRRMPCNSSNDCLTCGGGRGERHRMPCTAPPSPCARILGVLATPTQGLPDIACNVIHRSLIP